MHEAVKDAHEKFSTDTNKRIAKEKQEREKSDQDVKQANDAISKWKEQAIQNQNILKEKETKVCTFMQGS